MVTINAQEMLQNALEQELQIRQQIERLNNQLWGLRGQIDLLNQLALIEDQQAVAAEQAAKEAQEKAELERKQLLAGMQAKIDQELYGHDRFVQVAVEAARAQAEHQGITDPSHIQALIDFNIRVAKQQAEPDEGGLDDYDRLRLEQLAANIEADKRGEQRLTPAISTHGNAA